MSTTPNTISRCDDLGVCIMDIHCQRHATCQCEVRAGGVVRETPSTPAQQAEPDEAFLHAESCQDWLCRIVLATIVFFATTGACLAWLWAHDEQVRAALRGLLNAARWWA